MAEEILQDAFSRLCELGKSEKKDAIGLIVCIGNYSAKPFSTIAIRTLVALAEKDQKDKECIADSFACSNLLSLCRLPGDEEVSTSACMLVALLASTETGQRLFVGEKVIDFITQLGSSRAEPAGMDAKEREKAKFVQHGPLAPLVEFLKPESPVRTPMFATFVHFIMNTALFTVALRTLVSEVVQVSAENPSVCAATCQLLCDLSQDKTYSTAVVPAIDLLTEACGKEESGTQAASINALCILAPIEECAKPMLKAHVVKMLLHVCKTSASEETLTSATGILSALSRHAEGVRLMHKQEGAQAMISILASSNVDEALKHAMAALARLAQDRGCSKDIVECDGTKHLLALMATRNDLVEVEAAQIIACLASHSSCRSRLIAQGAVEPMLGVLKQSSNFTAITTALHALAALTTGAPCSSIKCADKLVDITISTFRCQNDSFEQHANVSRSDLANVLQHTAKILCNFTVTPELRKVLRSEGQQVILEVLRSKSESPQAWACGLTSLHNLSVDKTCAKLLVTNDVGDLLVKACVGDCSYKASFNAISALCNIAKTVEESRPRLVCAGAAECLVTICQAVKIEETGEEEDDEEEDVEEEDGNEDNEGESGSDDEHAIRMQTCGKAAEAMLYLSLDTANQQAMLQPMVKILSLCKGCEVILGPVAKALRGLSADEATVPLFMDMRLPRLVEQVSHSATQTETLASLAATLANIAKHAGAKAELGQSEKMVKCLLKFSGSNDTSVVLHATQTLAFLSEDTKNRPVLVERGVVWCLIQLLTEKQKPEIVSKIMDVLLHVSQHEESRLQIVMERAMRSLVDVLYISKTPTNRQKAAEVIANLTLTDKTWKHIVLENSTESLIQICTTEKDVGILAHIMRALANLSLNKSGMEQILDDGGIEMVVKVSNATSDLKVRKYIGALLRNLTSTSKDIDELVQGGVALPLIHLVSTSEDEMVLAFVTEAILTVCVYEETKPKLLEKGIMWHGGAKVLVKLVSEVNHDSVLLNATKALAHLAAHQPSRPVLIQKGVVPPIIALSSSSGNDEILANCAELLRNLARADGFRKMLVDAKAIESLAVLCSRDEATVKQFATGALANLALHDSSVASLGSDRVIGVIFSFIKTFEDCEPTVLSNAVVVLRNLAKHNVSRSKLLGQGLVSMLSNLHRCVDKRVVENSSLTLLNLAFDERGANLVVDEGGMKLLVAFAIETRDPTMFGYLVKAFSNLADHQPYRGTLVKDGVIDAIASVCHNSKVTQVATEAAAALCKFTEPSIRALEADNTKDWPHIALEGLMKAKETLKGNASATLKTRMEKAMEKLKPQSITSIEYI